VPLRRPSLFSDRTVLRWARLCQCLPANFMRPSHVIAARLRAAGSLARTSAAGASVLGVILLCFEPIGCGDDYACTGSLFCWERFPKDCLERDGCHIGPACVHAACAGLVGEIECTALPGCYWSEADGGCQSSPATCGNRTEANCLEGKGCGWGQACTGQARPCSENQTAEECGLHMGCSWRRVPNLN
jgi:hypothetical protein